MHKVAGLLVGLFALAAFAPVAEAHQVEYVSPHPVPHKYGGGFCYINVQHTHNYLPGDARMYRHAHGHYYFVGDPTPFGYDGPRYAYYGAHPVREAELRFGHPVFCYIKGPHYHWYQPPAQAHFQLSGGAYWYVGTFPQVYYDDRPRYAVINEAYASAVYTRPVVDVAVAPPIVAASISLGGPGWRAHAVVGGPPVHVVAPPPPPPGPPVQIGVGITVGGPVGVPAPAPPGHFHYDHGRHLGLHKHRHGGRPSRFILGPAPIKAPLLEHRRGHQPPLRSVRAPRPAPHRTAPAPRPAPPRAAPMPRAPARMPRLAPTPARGRNGDRGRRR